MRCCIASSTTSRLNDKHNQVSLAPQSKRRQWGGFRAAFFCFMAMPLTEAAGKANNPRRRLPLVLEVSLALSAMSMKVILGARAAARLLLISRQ